MIFLYSLTAVCAWVGVGLSVVTFNWHKLTARQIYTVMFVTWPLVLLRALWEVVR